MGELEAMLERSSAAEEFKAEVRAFCAGLPVRAIAVTGHAPKIKVRRVLTHLLATEPQLPIERLRLNACSGCSDFVGTVAVETRTGTKVYEFVWDCAWRARQEGWTDYFGFPDQTRAAQEFDWRCMQVWREAGIGTRD